MNWKSLTLLLIAVALIYAVYASRQGAGLQVGQAAPDFVLPTRNASVRLHDERGNVVLLNFWATWCPPCVSEMPSLEQLKQKMSGKDFEILAVSVDEGGWGTIEAFLKRVPVTLTILLDDRGEIASRYGAYQLPETYLIDKQGIIVEKYFGPRDWTEEDILGEITKYVESP